VLVGTVAGCVGATVGVVFVDPFVATRLAFGTVNVEADDCMDVDASLFPKACKAPRKSKHEMPMNPQAMQIIAIFLCVFHVRNLFFSGV
jgi:hypothetical protein